MPREVWSGYRVGKPVGGPECEALERELEAYYGVPYARVFNSCTAALHSAVVSAEVSEKWHEVVVPCYSMSASASCVLHAGGEPRFSDIKDDYCLHQTAYDFDEMTVDVQDYPKACIFVHLFGHHGRPAELNIPTIHDCAQSPSVKPQENRRQDVWCYSLNQWKIVSCGEGGYALTFSKEIADRLHAVRNHGECFTDDILGWNYRMTEMQASIAREEFRELDRRLIERRLWAQRIQLEYDLPDDPGNVDWFLYPVRTKPEKREALAKRIPGARVGYHQVIYKLPYFAKRYPGVHCPNAEKIESELVVIDPMHYGL